MDGWVRQLSGAASGGRSSRPSRERLDACLGVVEEAIERGELFVDEHLAGRLRGQLPEISPGQPLVSALQMIFAAQGRLLRPVSDAAGKSRRDRRAERKRGMGAADKVRALAVVDVGAMTAAAAQELTQTIRRGFGDVAALLLQAHDQRAWVPLGYSSWANYVRAEFALSRSRSYEMLEQARANLALCRAAGGAELQPISALAALQIKPVLDDVVTEVERRYLSLPPGSTALSVHELVQGVVEGARIRHKGTRAPNSSVSPSAASDPAMTVDWRIVNQGNQPPANRGTRDEVEALIGAIEILAGQTPVSSLIGRLTANDIRRLSQLPKATRWLEELLSAWSSIVRTGDALSAAAS